MPKAMPVQISSSLFPILGAKRIGIHFLSFVQDPHQNKEDEYGENYGFGEDFSYHTRARGHNHTARDITTLAANDGVRRGRGL